MTKILELDEDDFKMVKIKGWRLSPYVFERKKPVYYNKKTGDSIVISDGIIGLYHVFYDGKTLNTFRTKKEAVNYAINYMRRHPNG